MTRPPMHPSSMFGRRGWLCGRALISMLLLGCGGDAITAFAPTTTGDAAKLYWALTLDHSAVTLSTAPSYDTLQLIATPRDQSGAALSGLGAVTYTSSDSSRVQVTANGLLRAHGTAQSIVVVAELAAGNSRHADTVFVNVIDDPAPRMLATLSLHPLPGDSNIWAVNGDGSTLSILGNGSAGSFGFKFLTLRTLDSGGEPISGLAAALTSSNTTVAQALLFGPFFVLQGFRPGHVTLVASATAYGVSKADTVAFTITMPVFGVVKIAPQPQGLDGSTMPAFVSSNVTIAPGGTVVWANVSGEPVDIVFDDPTNVVEHGAVSCAAAGVVDPGGEGNIDAFGVPQDPQAPLNVENCRSRRFPRAGTYHYHSALTGKAGAIIVDDGVGTS